MGSFGPAASHPVSTASNHPGVCPGCGSAAISTAAKRPDAQSYWRCASCGEVWNAARRDGHRPKAPSWHRGLGIRE